DAGDESTFIYRTIVYDPFPEMGGPGSVLVENGASVIYDRTIDIKLDLPDAAFGMRIATKQDDLEDLPFMPVDDEVEFLLPECPIGMTRCELKIYVEYQSVDGYFSQIYYSQTFALDYFPVTLLKPVINGGALTTNDPVLTLTFDDAPVSIVGIEIA